MLAGSRIWLVWLPSVFVVNTCSCVAQYIHCEVIHRATSGTFEVTLIYRANDVVVREELWRALEMISHQVQGAWIILGDFNNVLNLGERLGSAVSLEEVAPFRQCIRECRVQDNPTTGPYYTWSNKQEGENRVFSKIDRVLANSKWFDSFRNAYAMFLPEGISYHCARVVKLDNTMVEKAKSFKFCNMWALDESFLSILQAGCQENVEGVPMYKVSIYADPYNIGLHRQEREARRVYDNLNAAKMSFIRQKVKQDWIHKGDENTSYFHSCLRKRRHQMQVHRIKDEEGGWHENPNDVEGAFLTYYKKLMGFESEATRHVSNSVIAEGTRVDANMKQRLIAPFNSEEVKNALFNVDENRAAGPDGYSSGFF
ncbi:uncharacterized protein LOC104896208 [Beta vulgaris subsp. vulgaris]|uniref:uncharacterized protein LOC104896208 n=1 Tax=Beta vulgaris subsp. vulgaris TaxID=3555 RepID=UPI0020370FB7|nr:uncharacterized protein LOC104896208 [Beta vulgaris subsp. vulgaris]